MWLLCLVETRTLSPHYNSASPGAKIQTAGRYVDAGEQVLSQLFSCTAQSNPHSGRVTKNTVFGGKQTLEVDVRN